MVATVATWGGRGIIWSRVAGGGATPKNIGWGTSLVTITPSAPANVNLFAPATEARTAGTVAIISTTTFGDTYQVTGTVVCAVGGKTIQEAGLFDAATPNSITTTVTNSLTSATTVLTLGTSLVGAAGNFYAQLGTETVLVTGAAALSMTCTRGVLGTTSSAWATGTPITFGGDGGSGTSGDTHTTAQTVNTTSISALYGGNMFIHADFAGIALNVNDSISFTFTDTLT